MTTEHNSLCNEIPLRIHTLWRKSFLSNIQWWKCQNFSLLTLSFHIAVFGWKNDQRKLLNTKLHIWDKWRLEHRVSIDYNISDYGGLQFFPFFFSQSKIKQISRPCESRSSSSTSHRRFRLQHKENSRSRTSSSHTFPCDFHFSTETYIFSR